MRKVIAISLPEATARQVDRIVVKEGYTSTSELFRDLLRGRGAYTDTRGREKMCVMPFRADAFIRAVKRHAQKGAPKTLSHNHDRYLYGK
ncbi:ribbon-helix-helix protein, CopG family [Candidatus Uhrbacteria bacterium]|nr:ribbon-helix-helix protein, CopG family [Candidatus Uhrbacteria bacterium]